MSLARERGMTAGGSVLFLTVLGTLSQLLGFGYRVALSRMVGAEVMGLYQLIMPVYSVLLSLTAVGLTAAVSNLTPQYLALGNSRGIPQLLGTCLKILFLLMVPISAVVLLCYDPISVYWLGDARTQLGLVLLLPCVALTGVENLHKHFFYGSSLVRPPAVAELLEQLVRTGAVLGLLAYFLPQYPERVVGLIVAGMVICEVAKTDGTVIRVDNPHNYPDPGQIAEAREPYAKVSIISPPDYVGNIMPMCQERRGIFKDMQYLDTNLVELHYSMPLGEIIYDFFDALKARTKGYASLDYELEGYQPSELVKVDLLLNGDQVDALSFIAHRDKAYPRARRICEKLKENIPRQLFEVPIQAAIGGKIIARETVKAMRKDVLAKCYGGDITRKKKLLEKQKEGKKKMRTLGTVQLPTEAFMAVLKLDEE